LRDGERCYLRHRPSRNLQIELAMERQRAHGESSSFRRRAMKMGSPRLENGLFGKPNTPGFHLRRWLPIVNTLGPHNSLAAKSASLLRHMEFSSILRWPGTSPVSRALPQAFAWSTILYRSPHTISPSLYSRADRHLDHGTHPPPSDERHVPVPMVPHAAKTDPAHKTGGLVDHRGRPHEKVPPPASQKAPPCQQRYGVIIDGPTQFAFADPLVLLASGTTRCLSQNRSYRGLPTLR
jgi:hypothetical protein